jgi:hypothetical protein
MMHDNLSTTRLKAGGTLLIEARSGDLEELKEDDAFVVSRVAFPKFRKEKPFQRWPLLQQFY